MGFMKKGSYLVISVAVLSSFVLASCSDSSTAATSSTSPSSTASSSSTLMSPKSESRASSAVISSEPVAITDEDRIIQASKKEFGESDFLSETYSAQNHFALIRARGSKNLTAKMTIHGMYLSMEKVLEDLKDLKEIDLSFNILYPLEDKYGNSQETTVIKATFKYSSRSKINWDNFSYDHIPDVADEWLMHPALKSIVG